MEISGKYEKTKLRLTEMVKDNEIEILNEEKANSFI